MERRASEATTTAGNGAGATAPPAGAPGPVSLPKRLLFVALTAAFGVLVVEGAAAVCLWFLGDGTRATSIEIEEVAAPGKGAAQLGFDPRQGTVLHPYLGYVLDLGASSTSGSSEQARGMGFPFNAHDLIQIPSPEILVVAIFGGSVAEQTYFYAREELVRGLASIERFEGRRPVLLNLASGGYKQPQQLHTLTHLLALGGHVDVVINLDGFNEIALIRPENLDLGTHPSYPRSWRLRVGSLSPEARRLMAEISWLENFRKRCSAWTASAPWRWSATFRLVRSRLESQLLHAVGEREQRLREAESGEADFQAAGPPVSYASWEAFYAEAAGLWSRSSWHMHQAVGASGGEYHHFLQPNQYVQGSKPLSPEERRLAFVDGSFRRDVGRGYPGLVAAGEDLRRRGVAFHSLLNIFSESSETLYVDTCCHVNAAGYRLIARRLVELMSTEPQADAPGRWRPAAEPAGSHDHSAVPGAIRREGGHPLSEPPS